MEMSQSCWLRSWEVAELVESIRVVDLTAKSPAEVERILKEEEREGWKLKEIGKYGDEVFAFLERK